MDRPRGKSDLHRNIQLYLQDALAHEKGALEVPFSTIGRIADFVLLEKKIIIEIQTSKIGLAEVLNRIEDYRSVGFRLIWLMHEVLFSKTPPLPVIRFLEANSGYFISFYNKNLFTIKTFQGNRIEVTDLIKQPSYLASWKTIFRFWMRRNFKNFLNK